MTKTRINFNTTYSSNTTIPIIRGNSVEFTFVDLPTRQGAGYNFTWNLREFNDADPITGVISQSDLGALTAGNQKSFSVTLDFPNQDYTLNTKYTLALQLEDPTTNRIYEGGQVILYIGKDSVLDEGQQIVNNANPEAFVRNVMLTGLDLALAGAISATDTILGAFGKLQNQITGKANKSGDTFTGKVIVENEVEINNSSIAGDNNGVIQKVDDVGGKGIFRWLFNNVSTFPVIASFFRAGDNTLDYVEFNGRVKASAPTEDDDVVRKLELDTKVSSDPTGVTGATAVTNMMKLTQAQFNAIATPDASTFYIITDA